MPIPFAARARMAGGYRSVARYSMAMAAVLFAVSLAVSAKAGNLVSAVQPSQEMVFDIGVGNLTIDKRPLIPGVQGTNPLEGTYFLYGSGVTLPAVPVTLAFEIRNSLGEAVYSWNERDVVPNAFPPIFEYQGTWRYELAEGAVVPLDYYTLRLTVAIDAADPNAFPGGAVPAEVDEFNNTNESIPYRVLQTTGNLVFGDIVTTLVSLDFFDVNQMLFTGLALWNGEIAVSFFNLAAGRDEATLDLRATFGEAHFEPPVQPFTPPGSRFPLHYAAGTLSPEGAFADVAAALPTGIARRRMDAVAISYSEDPLALGRVRLAQTLDLAETPIVDNQPMAWVAGELPFETESAGFSFDPQTGFALTDPVPVYQFADHKAYRPLVLQPSNDGYFQTGNAFVGGAVIGPDGLSCDIAAANVAYLSSFPFAEVTGSNLRVRVRQSRIDGGASGFDSIGVNLPAAPGVCPAGEPGPVGAAFAEPASIGADGSVTAEGLLAAPAAPRFNTYTFPETDEAAWYQPGWRLPEAPEAGGGTRPSAYLLAMREPGGAELSTHGDEPFRRGDGLFAGLNWFPDEFAGRPFSVEIGGKPLPLTATEWTKLYARGGGYSGVVDAVNQDGQLELYNDPSCGGKGYDIKLTSFGQAYLDNDSKGLDSVTDGEIDIPWPSQIKVPFERMTLNACGNPTGGKVPAAAQNEEQELAYWLAPIRLLTLEFAKTTPFSPDNERVLWITTKNRVEPLADEPTMQLHVRACGTLGETRIAQPVATLHEGYRATVHKIYLSAFDGNQANQPNGFYNLVEELSVPLFSAPKIHTQVRGITGRMADGGPWFGGPDPDGDRDGFPAGANPAGQTIEERILDYTQSRPVPVETRFADLITLRYRLSYSPATKDFKTQQGIKEDLIVTKLTSAVEYLNALRTEISFGLDFNVKPQLNFASRFGVFEALIEDTFLGDLRDKLEEAERTLKNDLSLVTQAGMERLLTPVVEPFAAAVQDALGNLPLRPQDLETYVTAAGGDFDRALDDLFARADLENFLRRGDNPALEAIRDVKSVLREIEALLRFDPAELGPVVKAVFDRLARGVESAGVDLDELLAPVYQTRDRILSVLNEKIRPILDKAERALDPLALLDTVYPPGEIGNTLVPAVKASIKQYYKTHAQRDALLLFTLKTEDIARFLVKQILKSPMFQKLNQLMTSQLVPAESIMRDMAQTIFDGVNRAASGFAEKRLAELGGEDSPFKNVFDMQGFSMKGYAIVAGNTLEKLHIDGKYQSSEPNEMVINGYLDMTRFRVAYKGKNCSRPLAGGPAMDTRIGAKDLPFSMSKNNLRADVELQLMIAGGALVNVGGLIRLRGDIKIGGVPIGDPELEFSVGGGENYVVASVSGVKFGGGNMPAGLFIGTTNCYDPLLKVSKDAQTQFNSPMFRGFYLAASGTFPLVNYGCLLRVMAEGGYHFWFFFDGPTFGARMVAGIYGEAACLVTAKGRLDLLGGYDNGLVFWGKAWIAGGIGFCEEEDWETPGDVLDDGFCLACVASFDLLYKNGWSSNYAVDCD